MTNIFSIFQYIVLLNIWLTKDRFIDVFLFCAQGATFSLDPKQRGSQRVFELTGRDVLKEVQYFFTSF